MTRKQKTDFGLAFAAAFRAKYGFAYLPNPVLAECMQCSRERVRQYVDRALRKIRRQLTPEDWETLNFIFQEDRQPAKRRHSHYHAGESSNHSQRRYPPL